MNKLRNQ